jgi:hypothetical protein
MKRLLTLLFLVTLFFGAKAQVLFYQDFESGVLDPMTAVDVDGKVVNPSVAGVAGPTFQVVQQTASNKCVVSTSWFSPAGQADDWLISPPITITDANTFLAWRAYSPDASYRDGYQVRISTTDNAVASFTTLALNVAAELTTWTQRSIKLNNYVGQTIYFAFRNNSNDKYLLFIDDIKAEVLKNNNVRVKSASFEKYNPTGTVVPLKTVIENHGAVAITSVMYQYTFNGNTYTDTVTGLNIAPLKSSTLLHNINITLADAGEFPVDINVISPNGVDDEDPLDNTLSRPIYSLSEQLPKKVLVEEATGTWCQWCPRGAVMMENLYNNYGDQVLPVAVHNSDPMTIPEYDAGVGANISGYPSGLVDRKALNIDPLLFDSTYNVYINRIVPVAVTTKVVWDPVNRLATVTGTAHLSVASLGNQLRFNCIVTESNVHHPEDSGYDQVNAYSGGGNGVMGGFEELPTPVPAEQMYYNFVARAIIGGFIGTENSVPDQVDANQDFNFSFTYEVPTDFNENEMKAIIIVQDEETGEVLNGDIQKLAETTSVPLVPVGHFTAYPNPTTDILNLTVDYTTDAKVTMKIYTPMGQLVRDLGNLDLSNGKQTAQIQVTDLSSGNYMLELRNKNSVTALPFTKM